jgi:molybdenum cofactor synthesis domain-containing protein
MSSFSHLAVGTEITIGQILNSNSQWLSQQCESLGLSCQYQLTVADHSDAIIQAAHFLSQHSTIIIVTGGLGPTSDDLTREIISDFTKKPLVWNEDAWSHLTTYLSRRQATLRQNHRKECYTPSGATLFLNPIGTACGFAFWTASNLWILLPGPPREIQSMWFDQIQPFLLKENLNLKPFKTWSLYVLGIPESTLAELLTPALESCPLEVGYRIYLPYIEFKLRYETEKEVQAQSWIQKIQLLLESYETTENLTFLLEKAWLHLQKKFLCDENSKPHSFFIFNPQQHQEVSLRFQKNPSLCTVLNLSCCDLQANKSYIGLEWLFSDDFLTLQVFLIYKKTSNQQPSYSSSNNNNISDSSNTSDSTGSNHSRGSQSGGASNSPLSILTSPLEPSPSPSSSSSSSSSSFLPNKNLYDHYDFITVFSPLNTHFSEERRKKYLIEKVLFDLIKIKTFNITECE